MFGILFVESFTGDYEDFVACWQAAETWADAPVEEEDGEG